MEKFSRLQSLLKSCHRKELESLIGHLNHACKVVRSGRSFLRRMIDLLHAVHETPHSRTSIRLNVEFRSDLARWHTFVSQWNGVSFLSPPSLLPETQVTSDASGTWWCDAWCKTYFQVLWGQRSQSLSIAEKELIPIILACDAWGTSWKGQQVRCRCDNQVVVACLRSRTSKSKSLMRCLVVIEAHHQCLRT